MNIEPNDSYDLPFPVNHLRVERGGTLTVKLADAARTVRTLTVSDGEIVNLPILRIFQTGTTATGFYPPQFTSPASTATVPLDVSFYGSPLTGEAPLSVAFIRTTRGPSIDRYWGYTTPDAPGCGIPFADTNGLNPTQVFQAAGNYTISLLERSPDNEWREKTREEYIVVEPPAVRDYDGTFLGTADTVVDIATVGRGGVWVDAAGDIWSTVSGRVTGVPTASNGYRTQFLKRPVYEAFLNGTIRVDFPATFLSGANPIIGVCGRLQPNGDHVLAHIDPANSRTYVYTVINGVPTGGFDGWASGSASSSWQLELALNDDDVTVKTYRDGVKIGELGSTTAGHATLSRRGVAALSCWQTGQVQASRVRVTVTD